MMINTTFGKSFSQRLDKLVLYTMNRRLPRSFEHSYPHSLTFEAVLEQTHVNLQKTAESNLHAPGEHRIWLHSPYGEILCRAKVRLSVDPQAPLLLYHHGFNEFPYYSSWQRVVGHGPFPAHAVCIQAPFHDNWRDPFDKGMASLQNIYQIFAGSLRVMELMQTHFEQHGAKYTILAGYSWGGITSVLYEAFFHRSRAVAPMLSSPNIAQVMWDIATGFNRPLTVPRQTLFEHLDFTPYYHQCAADRVFPLMGENDRFFRMENHAQIFEKRPIVTIPHGHITGSWTSSHLRQHVLNILQWATEHPLPQTAH